MGSVNDLLNLIIIFRLKRLATQKLQIAELTYFNPITIELFRRQQDLSNVKLKKTCEANKQDTA